MECLMLNTEISTSLLLYYMLFQLLVGKTTNVTFMPIIRGYNNKKVNSEKEKKHVGL